jgi:hypothetical protein
MFNVKHLRFVFKNFESIVVPINRISSFTYGDFWQLNDGLCDEDCFETNYINIKIIINDSSELNYDPLKYEYPLGMLINNPLSNNVEDRPNILGRLLNFKDLMYIDLLDENKKRKNVIYVPWGNDEEQNDLMDVWVDKDILNIEIKE